MSYGSAQRSLPAHSSLHTHLRPTDPDITGVGISLTPSNSSVSNGFSDLHPKSNFIQGPSGNDALMRLQSQQQTPLYWFANSQQDPWNHVRGRVPNVFPVPVSWNSTPSFSAHRTYTAPSDCETSPPGHIPSDSGYGSIPRQSGAESSLYGDRDQSGDTASVSSRLAGVQIESFPQEASWGQHGSAGSNVSVAARTSNLICQSCHQKVKTKSELKKHHQKHTKPHRCPVPGCDRLGGFSTSNDVDRHVRCRHQDFAGGSKGKFYKCNQPDCRSKTKQWPRADNFRQHLKRVHHIDRRDDDLEQYVYKPQSSPGPDLAGLTSIPQGRVPLDFNQDSASWTFPMQTTQQGITRNSYRPLDITSHQEVLVGELMMQQPHQQQLGLMSEIGDHAQYNPMQMSPAEPAASTPSAELLSVHDTEVSSGGDRVENFEESSFFNEAISDEESVVDDQSVIRHVSESGPEEVYEESRDIRLPASPGYEEASDADEHQDEPLSPRLATSDLDDPSSLRSTGSTPSSLAEHDSMRISSGAATPSVPQVAVAPVDFADVFKDKAKAFDLIKALKERGMLEGLLEQVQYQSPREEETIARPAVTADHGISKNKHACPEKGCDKLFPRQCELRKHMKRHVKPYGCTYPKCDKSFGSKNDWKRHENSQHYQLELWKCDVKSNNTSETVCVKAFNRREQFKSHLTKDHRITDPAEVGQKLEDCLDGRNCELKFWCGFCSKMVQVQGKGKKAWLDRCDHIDEHFAGQRKISEWKSADPGLQEVVLLAASNSTSRSQAQAAINDVAAEGLRALGGQRPPKRGAEGGAGQQSRAAKRPRQSALWYCCGCGSQQIVGFSSACLTTGCGGHEQCGDCLIEAIPSMADEGAL